MNRPAVVVFGWAGLHALLTLVLVGFSYRDPFPLIVYMCAVLLLGSFGTAVLLAARREPTGWYRTAVRSTSTAFLAIAVTLIGLGFVYGYWLMLIALYPLLLAAVLVRRERLSSAVVPEGWRLRFDPLTGTTEPRAIPAEPAAQPERPEPAQRSRGGRAVAAAVAAVAILRGRGR
ncbi:MAG TPA: hypothetical protein VHF06_20230 [Pseudonocardiaceae bacterium]|jgi:hypothetical protein|nr:hypothetical protein [Pseudonocardiaceae bacterium]